MRARIVDVVGFVVQNHQFVDVADDHAQVHLGSVVAPVGRLPRK